MRKEKQNKNQNKEQSENQNRNENKRRKWVAAVIAAVLFASGIGAIPAYANQGQSNQGQSIAKSEAFQVGMSASAVKEIQDKLIGQGMFQGEADGVYGEETKEAVTVFQQKRGLATDGLAGRVTLAYLGIPAAVLSQVAAIKEAAVSVMAKENRQGNSLVVSEEDKVLLARVITGEARGETLEGQIAVAAVVLNRMRSPQFPKTIEDVVYQKNAFSIVADGQVNMEPTQSSIQAAELALQGQDPTGGSLFFWNPKTSTCSWIKTRNVAVVIGNHNFGM